MVELLAPAGDFRKLEIALLYGADAVYIGGGEYSLRAAACDFSDEQLKKAIDYVHSKGKKVYVTANIIPHNDDIEPIERYARLVASQGADGLIVADLGAFSVCKNIEPKIPLHISTQANCLNYAAAEAFYKLGASRVILAREISAEQIADIRKKVSPELELEIFIHGSMCMAYSGRCVFSNYMTNRDANHGNCAQPCRWNYSLVEEKRPGEYIPIFENERGSFIFNSKDLCLIDYIREAVSTGVDSLKIEGRAKSEYYLASVVSAYRREIDRFYSMGDKYFTDKSAAEELTKISHRVYSTGFFLGEKGEQVYNTSSYVREYDVIAVVLSYDCEKNLALLEQRNKFFVGDSAEVLQPGGEVRSFTVKDLIGCDGEELESVPHSAMHFYSHIDFPVAKDSFLRMKRS